MTTLSRSYYAARGDADLYGMNRELKELILEKEDLVDFTASRSNDGMILTLVHLDNPSIRLDFASIGTGAWFQIGTLPDDISLGFNTAIAEPITDGQFQWITDSAQEDVLAVDIVVTEKGRFVTFPLPTTLGTYTGALTLVGDEITNDIGHGLREPLSVSMTITGDDEKLPQQGNEPYSRKAQIGDLQVARIVATRGTRVDDLVAQYMVSRELQDDQVLKMLQSQGPGGSTEILILWWRGTAPRVNRIAPANQPTISVDQLPEQIFVEFDQPVPQYLLEGSDGEDRILFEPIDSDESKIKKEDRW